MPDRNPLHILTYAQSLHGGGVERAMLRLVLGWAESGQRVTLVLGSADELARNELPASVELIEAKRSYVGLARVLPAAVRRARPDIVFCPGNHYSGAAAWLRLRLGRACPPIVGKVSNRLDRGDQGFPVRQGYRAWLHVHPRFLDYLVAMTPAMAAEAVRTMGVPADRISVIANPPNLAPAGDPTLPLDGDYLIGIGRLAPQKRWDRAIAALAQVARPDVKLLILGEGDERPALERQIAALGLGDRVRLPGYAANPHPALAQARALVLASEFEGAPGVFEEALAVGTPVITTNSSVAVGEIVSDAHYGSVVPVGDAQALIAAFDQWLAPDAVRPDPVPPRGADSVERYLALFDELVGRAG